MRTMYALKRGEVLDSKFVSTLDETVQRQHDLEESDFETGITSPKSEVKRVIVWELPQLIARFIKD